jgi:hypothetical protein
VGFELVAEDFYKVFLPATIQAHRKTCTGLNRSVLPFTGYGQAAANFKETGSASTGPDVLRRSTTNPGGSIAPADGRPPIVKQPVPML